VSTEGDTICNDKPERKNQTLFLASIALGLGFSTAIHEPSLREAAKDSGLLVGTAVRPAQLSETAYATTLVREFNMLEPEDALKWEVVHPGKKFFDLIKPIKLSLLPPLTR